MPEVNGFELYRKIENENGIIHAAFITAHNEMVFDAIHVGSFSFVRKSNFEEDISYAMNSFNKSHEINKMEINGKIFNLNDVLYIDSYHHKCTVHFKNDSFGFYGVLSSLEDKYKQNGLILCHKGVLVNTRHIIRILEDTIELDNNEYIPLSRRNRRVLEKEYIKYLTEF